MSEVVKQMERRRQGRHKVEERKLMPDMCYKSKNLHNTKAIRLLLVLQGTKMKLNRKPRYRKGSYTPSLCMQGTKHEIKQ